MDYVRFVFQRLLDAGRPDEQQREAIYVACRAEVAAMHGDEAAQHTELEKLEKVIRRQEMQARYEDTLGDG